MEESIQTIKDNAEKNAKILKTIRKMKDDRYGGYITMI